MENYGIYDSVIGEILIIAENDEITGLFFKEQKDLEQYKREIKDCKTIDICKKQLDEYFNGTRKIFDLKLNNKGTAFRKSVWDALMNIKYGEKLTYKQIAENIGNVKAVRAVGNANHNNNISIIVPCHRVIGANGKLVGYGGGLWRKEWLLQHEEKYK